METIILGRNGNQPFTITANGVSAQHAKITIDGDKWTLEDMNSTNGTFIRDEKGSIRQIVKVDITPKTFIYLGPKSSEGCFFYAHQVKTPGDFHKDYQLMNEKLTELETKIKHEEQLSWTVKLTTFALTFVLIWAINDIQTMRAVAMISPMVALLYDPRKRIKKIRERFARFFDCPNPRCSNTLSKTSVENWRCPECRNKM
jgi:hypothetical protein